MELDAFPERGSMAAASGWRMSMQVQCPSCGALSNSPYVCTACGTALAVGSGSPVRAPPPAAPARPGPSVPRMLERVPEMVRAPDAPEDEAPPPVPGDPES